MTAGDAQAYDGWRLVALSPLPGWARLALLAAAALSVWLAARGLARERHRGRRAALLSLRAVSALALAALLLEPGIRLLQTMRVKSRLLVLLDSSRSMGFPAESPQGNDVPPTRGQAAARWFADHRGDFRDLEGRFRVEYYTFGADTASADLQRLATAATPTGARTDILGALQSAFEGSGASAGRKVAAALVVSDGTDNVGLAAGVGPHEKAALERLGAPVSTVLVGEGGLRDLSIAAVKVDDFAFVRNSVTAEVQVASQGFSGESVPVTLTREGRVVGTQQITLEAGRHRYPVTFKFVPDQTGRFVYTVSVPVQPGEAVADNNKRAFVLKVIRDRVRVLLVAGRPSWDVRFLRGLLHQDPNVDLVSFFILRDATDETQASTSELSLIPFPTEEIFRQQIDTFDLVILQNFAWRPYFRQGPDVSPYFPDIRRYVLGGGALLMIGGDNSFGEGHYDETELGDVLPVTSVGLPPPLDPFTVRLTEEGKRHPVMSLVEGGEANARLWASLPALPGLNLVRAKPGARVLLEHPLLSAGGQNAPVLVVADEGRGRSMALTTDSSWYWSLPAEGRGLSNRSYERFWNNAIRWLVRDPDLTQISVEAERHTVEPGQPAAFVVKARQADYGPAAGAEVSLKLLDSETGKQVAQARGVAGTDGSARLELANLPPGAYRAVAGATLGGSDLGSGEDVVAVRQSGIETDDPLPRPELLQQIAKITGGSYAELPRSLPSLHALDPEVVEVGRRKDRPIWDNLWPLLALCLTMGSEWWLRRRWGHL
ncbi:MAG TPA: glutamine amidotransferase [Myxococcales bacterium]|nr:glutamine amidotransferase [Myxococcales bacterium]